MSTLGYILADTEGLPIINTAWALQVTWFIDPVSGNDTNTGIDDTHALKTWTELRRRMLTVGGPSIDGTTITIMSSLPSNDPMVTFDCKDSSVGVHVEGITSIVRSGSITSAFVSRNDATNQPNVLTDSAVSSWVSDIGVNSGRILKMTSGAAQNYYAFVVKNLGSHQARLSTFFIVDDFSEAFPANGDTYSILSLPFIPNYCIENTVGFFYFKFLDMGDASSTQYAIGPGAATFGTQFTYCAIFYVVNENSNIFVVNCAIKNCPNLYTGTVQIYAGTIGDIQSLGGGEIETAGEMILDNGTLFQGVNINIINFGYLRIYDAMFFDCPSNGTIVVGQGGFARLDKVAGSGSAGWGLNVTNTGMVWGNLANLTVTGASGDVFFCGNVITWASIVASNGVVSSKGLGFVIQNGQIEVPIANTIGELAIIPSINLKTTGQTTLITVPAGKTLDIVDIRLIVTAANTIAVAPALRVGKSPSYNEWAPITTLTGLNATNQVFSLATSAAGLIRSVFVAGETVKLDVTTGATATTLTATAVVFGYMY